MKRVLGALVQSLTSSNVVVAWDQLERRAEGTPRTGLHRRGRSDRRASRVTHRVLVSEAAVARSLTAAGTCGELG